MKTIIVGNGLAAVTVASNLHDIDESIDIEMFTEEPCTYYSRVRLVEYVVGNVSKDELIIYDEDWYEQRGITLHLNAKVTGVNTTKNTITVVDSSKPGAKPTTHAYDTLVIATGSLPVIPGILGKEREGWHVLRNIQDADGIREHLKQAERITILGSGLLGLELANAFRNGPVVRDTSIIEIEPIVAPVYLDKQGSVIFLNLLERAGVKTLLKTEVTELTGDKSIEGCRLADKTIHKGDMVIFACGIKPNVELLRDSNITIIEGIVIDEFMRTNVKNVYAVGDCCEFNDFIYGINPAAIEQAKYCAQNIASPSGKQKSYEGTIPAASFKGFQTEMVSLGRVNEYTIDADELADVYSFYKVDTTMGVYKKILLKKHRVIGAILLGDLSQQLDIRRMINERIDVSAFEESILQDNFSLRDYL